MMDGLVDATTTARLIATGRRSAVAMLDEAVRRMESWNPHINAVVVTRVDEARHEAEVADRALASGRVLGPLHGVPMTVKECFDLAGTPSTFGDPALVGNIADVDATAVESLRSAGAVIFGKTNVPTHLADEQTFNDVYGLTGNPWDPGRTPGGSSGGAAAAVAAGISTLELGSDVAGSVRNPAHFCGIYGHKATSGMIPVAGHARPGAPAEQDMLSLGPLTRSARDLDLMMRVLAPKAYRGAPAQPRPLRDFRAGVLLEHEGIHQSPQLTALLQGRIGALIEEGLRPSSAIPDADLRSDTALLLLRLATHGRGDGPLLRADARRFDEGARDRAAFVGRAAVLTDHEIDELRSAQQRDIGHWTEYFEEHDVLITPVASSTAYPHRRSPDRFDWRPDRRSARAGAVAREERLFWALLANATYLPATVVPLGRDSAGLPYGMQLIAGPGRDHVAIELAQAIEKALPPWTGAPQPGAG